MLYHVTVDGQNYKLELELAEGRWRCRLDGREIEVDAVPVRPDVLSLRIGSTTYEIKSESVAGELQLWVGGVRFAVDIRDPRSLRGRARAGEDRGPRKLVASMPGKVVRVLAREGDTVDLGTGVVVVEAMKMQNEIKSPKRGRVQKVLVSAGAAVNAGDVLAMIE
jgi:biotin carboxyl carrier protein